MAKGLYKPRDLRVVIDGISIEPIREMQFNRDTHDFDPFLGDSTYFTIAGRTRIELTTISGIELAFDIQNKTLLSEEKYEQVDEDGVTTFYIFGPFRRLMPSLFTDKDLLEWQLEYLRAFEYPKYCKYKYYRDDAMFDTPEANGFRKGYIHGKKYAANEYEKGRTKGRDEEIERQHKLRQERRAKRR